MAPGDLPVDLWRWGLALSPIVVLLVLLAVRGWKAPQAAPAGMALAALIALTAFRTPMENLAVAAGKGIWDALFILFVIWPALLLYRVVDNAGGFEALRRGVLRFSRNEVFLVLGFGWVFASFLQGITGFGTPIAVVAPLLVAIGVRPVYAVVIPLIGHAWANLFGTLAVAWLATLQVVDLRDETSTAVQTAVLLVVPNLLAGVWITWLVGRGAALRHAWPLIIIIGVIHGGGQLLLAWWSPVLANFLATTAALLVLYPLSNWRRFSEDPADVDGRPAMQRESARSEEETEPDPVMGIGMAVVPYAVLTVVAVSTVAIDPIESALSSFELGIAFPAVDTGYGVTTGVEDPYNAFAPAVHPGTFLLLAAAAAWLLYRSRDYYDAWSRAASDSDVESDVEPIGAGVVGDAVPASLAVVGFLVLSQIMAHSGQTDVLALGISEVAPAGVYAFFAGWIGLLGSFMTSSNTASNILFAPLQQTLAEAEGLTESTVIASQQAGAAVGNAASPANVVLGTGAAGIVGEEGSVLRKVLPYAAVAALTVGAGTVLMLA